MIGSGVKSNISKTKIQTPTYHELCVSEIKTQTLSSMKCNVLIKT